MKTDLRQLVEEIQNNTQKMMQNTTSEMEMFKEECVEAISQLRDEVAKLSARLPSSAGGPVSSSWAVRPGSQADWV